LHKTVIKKVYIFKKGKDNLLVYLETDDINKSYAVITIKNIDLLHGIDKKLGDKMFLGSMILIDKSLKLAKQCT